MLIEIQDSREKSPINARHRFSCFGHCCLNKLVRSKRTAKKSKRKKESAMTCKMRNSPQQYDLKYLIFLKIKYSVFVIVAITHLALGNCCDIAFSYFYYLEK